VKRLFSEVRPSGSTPLGRKTQEILKEYIQKLGTEEIVKPMDLIIITDGEPSEWAFSLSWALQ
jgi:hypothetical protein